MQLRGNILIQFTITSFAVITIFTVILATNVAKHIESQLLRTHVSVFPSLVKTNFTVHEEASDWFNQPPGSKLPQKVKDFFDSLLEIRGVFRLKVWNSSGTIIWSETESIIGENYKSNRHFQDSMSGEVSFSKESIDEDENISEHGKPFILEVYTPVFHEGEVFGVVELYVSDEQLVEELSQARNTIWGWAIGGGAILYGALLSFFWQAHSRYKKRTRELIETQDVTIYALAYQSEIHDIETGNHLERTTRYAEILAEELSKGDRDKETLTKQYIKDLIRSAPLHDIGKVGVADYILHKPGKLTDEEFDQMKKHCEYGTSILKRAEAKLSFASFLQTAVEITQYHHEKWDGTGYPTGLIGEDIPLSARIMAVADVYDALRSKRYYKDPIPHDECLEIVKKDSGKGLDPVIVDAFLEHQEELLQISRKFTD